MLKGRRAILDSKTPHQPYRPPTMDDEFSMLLRIHNSFGFRQFLDMVSSPVNAPQVSSAVPEPIHELQCDWMPISHVPSFAPEGGTSSTMSSLMTPMDPLSPPFSFSLPSPNRMDLPYPISPPLHLSYPQSYPFPLFAMQDYGMPFPTSPKLHTLFNDSQMPICQPESEYCIDKLQTSPYPLHHSAEACRKTAQATGSLQRRQRR